MTVNCSRKIQIQICANCCTICLIWLNFQLVIYTRFCLCLINRNGEFFACNKCFNVYQPQHPLLGYRIISIISTVLLIFQNLLCQKVSIISTCANTRNPGPGPNLATIGGARIRLIKNWINMKLKTRFSSYFDKYKTFPNCFSRSYGETSILNILLRCKALRMTRHLICNIKYLMMQCQKCDTIAIGLKN